jgi:two-component system, OmpR family, alkaline phosphatase synthesis response regulator PhoP
MEGTKKRILIVDDEEDLCEILQYNLENSGFSTEVAHSAEETLRKHMFDYDLFILDVMMGPISGFKLAEKIRRDLKIDTPIIFLTAKDTENDILTGFSLGADDYIPKPFSVNELTARVKAVLKRSENESKQSKEIVNFGNIEIDNQKKMVRIDNENIDLTKKEFEILKLLLENSGKIFSREEILRRIWGADIVVSDRTVDVNIARIRNKLGKNGSIIRNKTGYGYYLEI